MPCYTPLTGYRSKELTDNGKRAVVFNINDGYPDLPVTVPCGQCIGCRLEYSRQWAMRCLHEASLYKDNCFLTLTYDEENLPSDLSLDKSHFQKFMKRLRKQTDAKIRYYHCGEYGDENQRPHYHAILFNYNFEDRIKYTESNGTQLHISEKLTKLWPFGFSTIGSVTFDSAAYVARYVAKKITGKKAEEINQKGLKPYELYDSETGDIIQRLPEYSTMSRRPGIGRDWYDKYKDDCYPSDTVIVNNKRMRPPKYYDGLFQKEHEELYEKQREQRIKSAKQYKHDQTPSRMADRHKCKIVQFNQLKRKV